MAWDFETDPEFEEKLVWMRTFLREEIIPLETLAEDFRKPGGREVFARITAPLKEQVNPNAIHFEYSLSADCFELLTLPATKPAPIIACFSAPGSGVL